MDIPLVDLKKQYDLLKEEIDRAVLEVIERGQFILGQEVKAFEEEVAAYTGVNFAVGVASGTDAMHLSLLAAGIEPGDEVITTPFTFIATAEVITHCGATPVFADICADTCNIDPAGIESRVSDKTKAIIPVHLYGHPADMRPILKLAEDKNLVVIEDCAQALGAEYGGKKAGSLGTVGCYSFFPSKILGAYGDGGMVVTDDRNIAEKVTMLRNHGGTDKYYNIMSGFNSRLDEIQAAVLRVKFRHLENWIDSRQHHAEMYNNLLGDIPSVRVPTVASGCRHIFNYYTICLAGGKGERDKLKTYLASKNIGTAVYYPLSLHLQKVYQSLRYKPGDFPVSEKAQEEVLSLPMYPELSEEQIEFVTEAVKEYFKG